jgi:hypothetical protein
MDTLSADRAGELLGGTLNGHDLVAGHANRNGLTLLTTPHRWHWRQRDPSRRSGREARPGSGLIAAAAVQLLVLGCGLLAVSFAAQYQYVLRERHQHAASLIEAGALDVGLIIFSLLALGLARAGLSAKIERAAVVGSAVGSAVMNYAAADVTSPRSVLAYCMPPVFLAFVVDRVVRTIQRHVLGMSEGRSPWAVLADAARRITRFWVLSVLYVLRFLVDRRNTCAGLKLAILNAAPVPGPVTAIERHRGPERYCFAKVDPEVISRSICGREMPCPDHPVLDQGRKPDPPKRERGGTKTGRFLDLVRERHGELARIPLDQVSRIATALAPEAELHPASARTALLGAVRAALPGGEGDAR